MTVKVRVDWDAHEILTEEEYKKRLQIETLTLLEDKEEFNEWLSDHYTPQYIWHLTEAGRREVMTRWEEYCQEIAEVRMDYEETLIKV